VTLLGFERTPAYRLRLWVVIGFADSGISTIIGFVDTARAGVHWLRAKTIRITIRAYKPVTFSASALVLALVSGGTSLVMVLILLNTGLSGGQVPALKPA